MLRQRFYTFFYYALQHKKYENKQKKRMPLWTIQQKKELAMAYCPDIDYTAALKKLNQWIRNNTELSARLAATGYIPTQRRFTPQQVRLLFHYLGEPF